jgi:hypothetical protein
MRAAFFFMGLLLVGLPAQAQTVPEARLFQPPAGCDVLVTVQGASCTVEHQFTCQGDPAGWRRRVAMDAAGIFLSDLIDDETQWVEANYFEAGSTETLAPSNPDPASLSTLLSTGMDSYDFSTDSPQYGSTRYVGEDRLTGETVVIDGVTLDVTTFIMTAYDAAGAKLWTRRGEGFVHRGWRTFFGGREVSTVSGAPEQLDGTPVEFVFPGERGFLSMTPREGCNQLMSSLGGAAEGQG